MPVAAGDQPEIGVFQLGERIAAVVEKLLPLADHAQKRVVQQDDLHGHLRLEDRAQLLNGHLQTAVAHEKAHFAVGGAQLAPMAAGSPKPIVPSPPEVTMLRLRRNPK